MRCLRRRVLALIVVSVFAIAGCGGDDDDDAAAEPTSTTQATVVADPTTTVPDEAACPSSEEPLRIVLVNDDGVVTPALDAMVDLLGEQEGVELTIVAPAASPIERLRGAVSPSMAIAPPAETNTNGNADMA